MIAPFGVVEKLRAATAATNPVFLNVLDHLKLLSIPILDDFFVYLSITFWTDYFRNRYLRVDAILETYEAKIALIFSASIRDPSR